MKRAALWILAGSVAAVSAAFAYGCVVNDTCASDGTCARPGDGGTVEAAEAAVTSAIPDSAGSCVDGGNCSVPADGASEDSPTDTFVCDPTKEPRDQPCVLADSDGVFVASALVADGGTDAAADAGADAGASGTLPFAADGSMARPYSTIGQALANLGKKTRIYVCNGAYAEQVRVTSPVSIYGGLSCPTGSAGAAWAYVGGNSQVTSPSPDYALSVTGVASGTVTIEDMAFASPSAIVPGGSSIAALVAASTVHLRRVTLKAGNGAAGAAGADGISMANYAGVAPSGGPQVWNGTPSFMPISGGPGAINKCAHYGSSAGGDGGLGCAAGPASPGLGRAGTAVPPAPVTTAGRDGLSFGSALPDAGTNANGDDPGADGLSGKAGVAAAPQYYGTLSPGGWMASPGGDGAPGNPGQGGAGGSDPFYNACSEGQSIGGGGGGAGGCGGAGGKGGSGGGASVAIAAFEATIDMQECVLGAAAAGAGGPGGAGQDGQAGGAGGDDVSPGPVHKAGAAGGNGAGGSGGAGGTGGISVGVLYTGGQLTYDPATSQNITLGPPGAGGTAGPAGKHPAIGILTTGYDGSPGETGAAGTSAAFFKVM